MHRTEVLELLEEHTKALFLEIRRLQRLVLELESRLSELEPKKPERTWWEVTNGSKTPAR